MQPRHRAPSRPAPRLAGDGGSVVVEAVLVLPILVALLAGMIDFGIGFRNRVLLQSAIRNGARTAAAAVNNPTADQLALSTMMAGLSSATALRVDKAIIFEANNLADGQPLQSCKDLQPQSSGNGSTGNNCNVYGPDQILAAVNGTFDFGASACTGWSRYWCPANERTANLPNNVDALGFYVEASYESFTGLFADRVTITDSVVMRLEPAPG